jgi:hypothetical protein
MNCYGEEEANTDDSNLCTKEELMTYFPQPLIKSILIKSKIEEDKAEEISKDLAQKGQDLEKLVAEKASSVEPNPFKDLSQRDTAIKIYRETLYEVFAKTMQSHGISNEDQIQLLLEDMQSAKSKLFVDCIKKEQIKKRAPPN